MPLSPNSHVPRGHLAALVGLCPLLALAPDAARALTLALAIVLMSLASLPWWAVQRRAPSASRWPATLLVLASAAGATQLLLDAFSHGLHPLTEVGVPLVAANLALWTSTMNTGGDALDAAEGGAGPLLLRALSAAAALLLLGVVRELCARGSVFATAEEYFGGAVFLPQLHGFPAQHGLLLFAQPAGALFALACLIAALQARRSHSATNRA